MKTKPSVTIALFSALILLLSACGSDTDTQIKNVPESSSVAISDTTQAQIDSDKILAEAQKEYEIRQMTTPMTKDQYPKTYAAWGDEWMTLINDALPKAALLVDSQPACVNVVYAGLSEDLSIVRQTPVFFVDCDSHLRYFVSADDVANGTVDNPINTNPIYNKKEQ